MKLHTKLLTGLVAAATLAPALAAAQETRVIIRDRPNQVLEVGGGVNDYTQGLNGATDPGTAWDVRAIFGARSPIGLEAAYVGALNNLNGEARDLMMNGGEALLRVNLTQADIQPFLAAGVGIHNFSLVDIRSNDDGEVGTGDVEATQYGDSTDLSVPAAAGVQAYINDRVTLGGRVSYRYIFEDQVVADEAATDAQSWAATARLGVAF